MIRQNKKMILFTSVITLLPIFIGLFLWNQLPDSHLVCVVATNIDPKSKIRVL